MGTQDAKFKGSIYRKDSPIILACRRDQAVFLGARIVYDATGYLPGQALVRKQSDGLFYKWSVASGSAYDSPVVLYDDCTSDQQLADGSGLAGVSGASLVRVLAQALVYTSMLVDADAGFLTALKSKTIVDSMGTSITKF